MDQALALIASRQLGLITRKQLLAIGMSRRMIGYRVSIGRLSSIHPGVYRIAGAPEAFDQLLLAALLAAGDGAVSYKAAAVVFGLQGVRAELPEITVSHDRRIHIAGVVVHRTRALDRGDVCLRGPLRITTPARTLVDLSDDLRPNELENAMDDALRRNLTSLAELRAVVAKRGGRGVPAIAVVRAFVRLKDGSLRWR
jgi:predicted transcriptional regulator of viral defense system